MRNRAPFRAARESGFRPGLSFGGEPLRPSAQIFSHRRDLTPLAASNPNQPGSGARDLGLSSCDVISIRLEMRYNITMQKLASRLLAVSALGLLSVAGVRAEDPARGVKTYFLAQLNDTEKKFIDLAQAIPAEKYSWRPGEGVRSISEVLVHVSGADVMLGARFLGAKMPENIKLNRNSEKELTDKAKIIETMKTSFAFLSETAAKMSDADLQKPVKLFGGQETNGDGALMFISNHMHEHLGQLIAYARTNGVVPPWSQKQ